MKTRPRKVLIVHVPSLRRDPISVSREVKYPLLSLFSHLRTKGVEADVLDLELELGRPQTPQELEEQVDRGCALVAREDFEIAAISCYTSYEYYPVMRLAAALRSLRPEACLVTGGWHPSVLPEDFTAAGSPFDFVIRGEAELALTELARGECPARDGETRVVLGRPLSLDDEDNLLWKEYPYQLRPGRAAPAVLSRGCPFQCAYCLEPTAGGGWRAYSALRSVDAIERLAASLGTRMIMVQDPLFGFQKGWRREFLKSVIDRRLDVDLTVQCRVDMLDSEDVALLAKANIQTWVGVESASPRMVRAMNKAADPSLYLRKIDEVLAAACREDALFGVNLIENHPGESPESFRQSHDFFRALADRVRRTTFCFSAHQYTFFPGASEFHRIGDYERHYGTRVLNKRWWNEPTGAYEAASVVASSQTGRLYGERTDYWREDFDALERAVLDKASSKLRLWLASVMVSDGRPETRAGSNTAGRRRSSGRPSPRGPRRALGAA